MIQPLLDELRRREALGAVLQYRVPALWRPLGAPVPAANTPRDVNPYLFLREHLDAILAAPQRAPDRSEGWVGRASIYNLFVRLGTAYDHDGDGRIGSPNQPDRALATLNREGLRETGTFLKSIALLGHIHALGCDTVHLLPVTAVGRYGNKGKLGSPYAIQHPYRLEPTLADPLVELPLEAQFRAFVDACHHLGIRVVTEFVFRTSARDGDWVKEHPDWYYWIRREIEDRPPGAPANDPRWFGMPPFDEQALATAKSKIDRGDRTDLPAPPQWYRDLFTAAPSQVTLEEDGRWLGLAGSTGCHIPSAFADWPPDDLQPPWTDVTYLRMYDHPDFNYVAYNTIRQYDDRLARPENAVQPLWDAVRGIIPHFQREFGIDGVMVDMGHALPHALMKGIIDDARKHDPHFGLLSENFTVARDSRDTGYDCVLGYQFYVLPDVDAMRALIERSCVEGLPIPVFGTGETHNTPRVAMRDRGPAFCRTVWLLNAFLPDTIPFIHNGFELADPYPVNTGLAFTEDELRRFRGQPLGLFDATTLPWDGHTSLVRDIIAINALRARHPDPGPFAWLDVRNPRVIAFKRGPLHFVLNWDPHHAQVAHTPTLTDALTGAPVATPLTLAPGQGVALR